MINVESTIYSRRRQWLVAQMVKRLSTLWETRVRSLGWEDPLEKEMAIHSSTTAWKISWTEKPGRLQSMGSQTAGHNWATSVHNCTSRCAQFLSRVQLFVAAWTADHHSPLSMGFLGQEYWSGLPFLTPGDLPDSGIKLAPLESPELASIFFICIIWKPVLGRFLKI